MTKINLDLPGWTQTVDNPDNHPRATEQIGVKAVMLK